MTSPIAGVNHRLRNTPVSKSTTKLHSAISPSMNDQWSGKTLRRFFFASVARPSRSSAQPAAAPTLLGLLAVAGRSWLVEAILRMSSAISTTLPEARSDRLGEVPAGGQITL